MKKHARVFVFIAMFVIMAIPFTAYADGTPTPSKTLTFSVWGEGTKITIDPNNMSEVWHNVNTLTTRYPIDISLGECVGYDVKVNGMELKSNSKVTFQLEKLGHNIGIPIQITNKATGATVTKYIRTLNPAIDIYSYGKGDGYYYFTKAGYYCQMNGNGDIVFYGYRLATYDFKPHLINGKLYYTVICSDAAFTQDNVKAYALVLNDKYAIVDKVNFLDGTLGMPENQPLDIHEFRMIDVGHYIIESYVQKRVTNIPSTVENYSPFGSRVIAAVVQEIKDGKLIFQWDSTEHEELYALSEQNNDYTNSVRYYEDYAHINSVEIDPTDNNLILSLRNMSTVLKIDRTTGEIIWILGGSGDQFGLTDDQKFSAQHYARISPRGTITVFDNGMVMPAGEPNPFVDKYNTRVVEYKLDEKNKKLVEFREYSVPGTSSPIMGSAELIDPQTDTFLIGWGGRRAGTPLFSEVNFSTNKVIFEVFDKGTDITTGSYRAYKSSY